MPELNRLVLKTLTLLYVEDNENLLLEIQKVFGYIFNKIYTAKDGKDALKTLDTHQVDIIITDLHMPNMDGIEFIKEVRSKDKKISIIVLTAHADKDLLLEASNLQLDGYLTKPINFNKISQALSNALQRLEINTSYTLKNNVTYNISSKTVQSENNTIKLGQKEAKLLDFLISNSHKVVTKEDISYHIWDIDSTTDSALKNLISNLRSKIGKNTIINYPGHGWKIKLQN